MTLNLLELDYSPDSSHYFEKIRALPLATFLDSCSSMQQGAQGRYDIMTAAPSDTVTVNADGLLVWEQRVTGAVYKGHADPFTILSEVFESMPPVNDDRFPFTGGIAGFWSYELNSLLEPGRALGWGDKKQRLMVAGLFWWAIVTDHQEKSRTLIFHSGIADTTKSAVLEALRHTGKNKQYFALKAPFSPTISPEQYDTAFRRIQAYIAAGDCYQVNLTQSFTAPYTGDSWTAYHQLRQSSPSPYSAYLDYPGITLLSLSPERFIKVEKGIIESHPIKGTIARGADDISDKRNAQILTNSEKDRAENLMIVDLLRNDLGKVCEIGSIAVPRLFALESFANVHHLVSEVTGKLRPTINLFNVLSSIFPGGSITGAPKIRAMEIIRELEAGPRSAYCGSVGYVSSNGNMDMNIAIRTLVADGHTLSCWGGGAIVADSKATEEYNESVTKVQHLMSALHTMTS
ncbi:aminodeoxychorismate synthase component I [Candidatus Sororendozoicomonas aggregata]|uniref:aminodeoxychorismate synthase component I n=1 Tax=Candidatus Sororendozoicomonas aggregata TaxID=3073239 RepID=UPI002ED47131